MKYSLKKRINALSIEDLQDMSHRSVCRLTDGFKEPYIRYIVARESTKQAQKDVLNILKTKKRDYDKENNPLGINPFFLRCPQFFDDMEFDIDCNKLIDNDGIIESVTLEEQEDIIKENNGHLPTIYQQMPLDFENVEEEINYLKEQIESSCKTITDLQEEINRLKQENKELEERYSISEETLNEIFPSDEKPQVHVEQSIDTEQKQTIEELHKTIQEYQEKVKGLNPQQAALFGHALAEFCASDTFCVFTSKRKREDLAPMVNKLFGWGEKSVYNKMTAYQQDDREAVASVFDVIWPQFANFVRRLEKWEPKTTP